ncbi:hypothetical protein Taro_004187 [Colocasia esculenta]|uniref:RING-type E3 ubiquitin transferase n=1 Tax=Colocasia esculenta TaxID=4460 RepID=A0A843THK6_COLES|nr:hypothetical protein [Colocasia esculenta]
MVEVVELFLPPLDGEDEEIDDGVAVAADAAPYWAPPIAPAPSSSGSDIRLRRGGRYVACQISSDSDSEAGCLDEHVELALDLCDRELMRREGGAGAGAGMDPFPDAVDPFGFAVFDGVEEMGSDYLEMGMGLGLRFEVEKADEVEGGGGAVVNLEEEEGSEWGGDGFFVGRRGMVLKSGDGDGEPSGSWDGKGMRMVGFGLESDSDEEEVIAAVIPRSHNGDMTDQVADDLGLPLYWDCLRIEEERRDPNEDFEWEEVDGRVDEREILSMAMDADGARSIVLDDSNVDLELEDGEYEDQIQNVEWEVLLAMNSWERNVPFEHEDAQSYLVEDHEDFVYASEYEVLFGQFADNGVPIKGSPPAAKSVIEHLPTVMLTQLDVADHVPCAVCKEEFSLEEKAKRLPCSHHYHEDCIVPWLRVRNTCPVCRYELPTDDPDYENWRAQRTGSRGVIQRSHATT